MGQHLSKRLRHSGLCGVYYNTGDPVSQSIPHHTGRQTYSPTTNQQTTIYNYSHQYYDLLSVLGSSNLLSQVFEGDFSL